MSRTFRSFLSLSGLLLLAACGNGEPAANAKASAEEAGGAAKSDALSNLGAAPKWELTRVDGGKLTSEELKGKVVVLDFWATWCPPCRAEIPGYVEMQKQYADQGLVIVGVSLDQAGPKVVKDFAKQFKINYPLVMGDQGIVEAFGDIQAIPTTFLIDRDGQIRHRKVGAMHREEYEPIIKALL